MKSFAFVLVVVQAVLIQNAYTYVVTGGHCGCSPPLIPSPVVSAPVYTAVAQPSVASSLADTLSLLTVSSLLAETLPLNPNVVAAVPVPVGPAYAPVVAYGGCGCGDHIHTYGCGGCGCGDYIYTHGYGGCGCGGYHGHGCSYIY